MVLIVSLLDMVEIQLFNQINGHAGHASGMLTLSHHCHWLWPPA